MHDIVVLAADKPMERVLDRLLRRHESLGIRELSVARPLTHPQRDGGVRTRGAELLTVQAGRCRHAIMVFDREGSGGDELSAEELERRGDEQLSATWGDRGKCIVIDPELDAWMWGSDAVLRQAVGWTSAEPVRQFVTRRRFELKGTKPVRPKEAMAAVLKEVRLPMSAAVYEEIADRISLKRCTDSAFGRLRVQLRSWFGGTSDASVG